MACETLPEVNSVFQPSQEQSSEVMRQPKTALIPPSLRHCMIESVIFTGHSTVGKSKGGYLQNEENCVCTFSDT